MSYSADGYCYLAACIVQLYELLTGFDEDVRWIWLQPWSWIKWDFIFMRYGCLAIQTALLYQHTHSIWFPYLSSECRPWVASRFLIPYVYLAATQVVIIGRVWALYHHDKRVLVVLVCLYVLSIIFTFVFIGMVLSRPMLHGPDCHPKSKSISWAFFATCMPSLVLDLAMLVLTIRRVLKISREPHAEPLLLIILRDGIWAVFLTWITVMAALIMSLTGRLHIAIIIANSWFPAITSFITTRLILNLRRLKDGAEYVTDRSRQGHAPMVYGALTANIDYELSAFSQRDRSITLFNKSLTSTF